ncbi:MAG: taurine dioxygenase [Pseudomonadales bacterium]|jgi:taurine dioxygenase|nr:taurine dioxygenase [Pseudomonadales bacterium]MDP7314975.1 taurine dioxygenase [Pseudomonadales bacterium]|tara:strand:+ start:399 stop:1223 length:825 start_codon:yes stop_codon:yes gene_type:complete
MLQLEPYAGALGALVTGIDLTVPVNDVLFQELNNALLQYEVLFFRHQPISPQNHADLAGLFGPPQLHQAYPHVENFPQITILENDEATPSKIEMWHTDMTFRKYPPQGAILHGVVIPEKGGDTLFASMSAAYEGLSGKMQEFLCGLTAIHDFTFGFRESLDEPGGRDRLAQMVIDNPPVEHPVIRTHPLSGKKGLFVNSLFTSRIKDMTEKESRMLLDFLFDHAQKSEYTCRFRWQPDSVAFWDNRITQHKPVNDYWPQHRRMQRITIDGDEPY